VCAFSFRVGWRKYSFFLYKYMFLKINHLFRSFLFFFLRFMKFFPRKNIFLHPKSKPEKKAQGNEKQQAINVRGKRDREGERNVMCIKHHVVYFLQSIVVSAWPCFLLFFRVCTHSRNMAQIFFFFRKLCLPIRWKFSPCSSFFFSSLWLCVDVQIFQICPYICSLCSAGDLSSL
jgi:hypothetical protein